MKRVKYIIKNVANGQPHFLVKFSGKYVIFATIGRMKIHIVIEKWYTVFQKGF